MQLAQAAYDTLQRPNQCRPKRFKSAPTLNVIWRYHSLVIKRLPCADDETSIEKTHVLVVQNGMQCVCADARRCDRAGFERNNDREGLLFLVVSATRTIAYDAYLKRVCKPLLDGKG